MIYLLEDDDSIRKLVLYTLESQGYQAEGFSAPSAFWQAMRTQLPQLILLDVMLPEEDGLTVLKKLRGSGHTMPVILLTAKNTEYDRVLGLDQGADDFISKPFGMMELLARIRAVLRRTTPEKKTPEYCVGPLRVIPAQRQAQVNGQDILLTHKEFDLLLCLAEQQGRVLTRDQLMDRVWGIEADRENRTLDVHIRTLRVKLGEAGSLIETVRGIGYKMGAHA
ncbi:MAG: response regulator transcription factor [Ruminococcaceae bacterium]|nr:response regulator transcription factor [Oscillospiraceae bacterium]